MKATLKNECTAIFFIMIAVLIPLCFLIQGCSLRYGNEEDKSSSSPEFVFHHARLKKIEDGKKAILFDAEKLEQYSGSGEMFGETISFDVFEKDGTRSITGSCGMFSADTDKELYEFFDSVLITLYDEDAQIKTETMHWNAKTQTIAGSKNENVAIQKGGFSKDKNSSSSTVSVSGTGFSASAKDTSYSLNGPIKGIIVQKEEKDLEND